MELNSKHILVVGASSGIGKQAVIDADIAGAKITFTARRENKLSELHDSLQRPEDHRFMTGDITDLAHIEELASSADPVDGLVYAAGRVHPYPVKYLDKEMLDLPFQVNFYSAVQLVSALLRKKKIKDAASFVFISSVAAKYPFEGGAAYCASKAALETYSKTLAMELSGRKIRSNCIAPAMVKTDIFEETVAASGEEILANYEKSYLLGFGEPVDVSGACIYLLSDRAKWMTGQTLELDGGYVLGSLYQSTKPG